MNSQIALVAPTLFAAASACTSGSQGQAAPKFSLSVDDAQLDRVIAGTQPASGNVFVDVGVTLTNLTDPTPVPVAFSFYALETTAALVYPSSMASAHLSPICGNVSVAKGGHLFCRVAFEVPTTEVPSQIDYSSTTGTLKASAPIPSVSPLPCGAPGLRCGEGGDCCTGVCDPTAEICSLIGGACTPAGGACSSPLECCTGNCYGGVCANVICLPAGQPVNAGTTNCCTWQNRPSGGGYVCATVSSSCGTIGENCSANGDCCSSNCGGGRCISSGTCNINGEICFQSSECCSGFCRPSPTCATKP